MNTSDLLHRIDAGVAALERNASEARPSIPFDVAARDQ